MTYASQFAGDTPVGSQALMVDVGPTVTLADNSTWLRSGTLTTTASAPQLAAIKAYQVVGTVATTPIPSTITIVQLASNGSGTLIATTATDNTLYRSTDSGVTWSLVNPGVFGGTTRYHTGIAYGGGRFVISGWRADSSAGYLAYSTNNGATWTLGANIPLLQGLYNYIRLTYASNKFVGVCQGNSSALASNNCFTFYSTDGSACTTYNSGASLNSAMNNKASDQQGYGIISSGATVIAYPRSIYSGQSAPWIFSLDSGVTWSSTTPVSNSQTGYYFSIAINGTAVSVVLNGNIYNFANLTSPTVYTVISLTNLLGYTPSYQNLPISLFSVGSKTFGSPGLNYIFQMSNDLKSIVAGSYTQLLNQEYTPIASTDLSISGAGTTTVYDANLSTYSYCGIKTIQFPPNNSVYNGETWYVRAS